MPKGTTPHYQKKNSTMAEAWKKRKTAANASNTTHQLEQKFWRKDCLSAKDALGTLTDKNRNEWQQLFGSYDKPKDALPA